MLSRTAAVRSAGPLARPPGLSGAAPRARFIGWQARTGTPVGGGNVPKAPGPGAPLPLTSSMCRLCCPSYAAAVRRGRQDRPASPLGDHGNFDQPPPPPPPPPPASGGSGGGDSSGGSAGVALVTWVERNLVQAVCTAWGVMMATILGGFSFLRSESKSELKDLRSELKDLRSELKNELKDLRTELKSELKDLEQLFLQLAIAPPRSAPGASGGSAS